MNDNRVIDWLLDGDASIRYQTYRDLLDEDKPFLRKKIAREGWGARFLAARKPQGYWGRGFYAPKWISSHYTLLDLKNLNMMPDNKDIKESIALIVDTEKGQDGGINPSDNITVSDVCINGMFLNYAAYFESPENSLKSTVDYIITQNMSDGGFNCMFNRQGAKHSSVHSTISVLEGIEEYKRQGHKYRLEELKEIQKKAEEFLLKHYLYKSERSGQIIRPDMIKLHYPNRWYYDILRALDYFQYSGHSYDIRMQYALNLLLEKRRPDKRWNVNAHYSGETHYVMEKAGQPSRWITLKCLRVLKQFS